jgi:hypothetical protein
MRVSIDNRSQSYSVEIFSRYTYLLTFYIAEMGIWRCEFSSVFRSEEYKKHYLLAYPAAEPVAEFDDRNRLYSLKPDINYSAGHPGTSLRRT